MKKYLLTIATTLLTISVQAQNGINSPYSRYGFGLLSERAMGFNKGMGGVAQGFREGTQINIVNPASYSAIDSLTALFDLGLTLQNGNYKMGEMQQNVKNSSFDYFAFQFRAAKNVGVTLSILPISNIKYSFSSQNEVLEGTENVSSSYGYTGDGGLREVMIGTGWRPIKQLSLGANVSYVWGDYSHTMNMVYNQQSAFSLRRQYSANISTYNAQLGLQYIQPISKNERLVIGATYTHGHDVNNKAYRTTQLTHSVQGSSSSAVDTESIDTVSNAFQFPTAISAGITYYYQNKFRIGADFELQKWGDCRFPVETQSETMPYQSLKGQLNDRKKVSLGLDYTPDPNHTQRGYLRRITYKLGGYYAQSYAKADGSGQITDKPYEFGVSAGMSLPIRNRNLIFSNFSKINVAVQWVHTNIPYLNASTLAKSELTENYLRLCLGVTINEHWFYKWRLQ